jgi:putative oxidoreductase
MKTLFQTDESWAGFTLRLTLGLVMLPHGAQKLRGGMVGSDSPGLWDSIRRRCICLGSSRCW